MASRKTDDDEMPSLDDVLIPAMNSAFLKAAEKAKQTQTPLVVWREGEVVRIPHDEIDEFIKEQVEKEK